MLPTPDSCWYSNPDARRWRASPSPTAVAFHRTFADYAVTPLTSLPSLAAELGVGSLYLKDESNRLGLPAFKILGASWAVCRALCEYYNLDPTGVSVPLLREHLDRVAPGVKPTLVTATDGNHGRAVAHMARLLGIGCRVYLPAGISPVAIHAIEAEDAKLITIQTTYDHVVAAAAQSTSGKPADLLIQDTSWAGYTDVPSWIVEGYRTLFAEVDDQLSAAGVQGADLVACPVGVGSLAHALVNHYREPAGSHPALLSVEPATAACIARSLLAGESVTVDTSFPSIMSGLNCGTASELGWPSLLAGLDAAVTVSEDECRRAVRDLSALAQDAGPCGAATLSGVRNALSIPGRRDEIGLGADSVIVLVSTEGLAANPLR